MHDTRAIAATLYYIKTKDIAGARDLLGHSEETDTIHKYIAMIGNVASKTLDDYHRSREKIPTLGDKYANPFV